MITGEEALHLARKELGKIKDAIMLSVSNFVSNLTASINTVANNLSAEISARQSADSSLQSTVNNIRNTKGVASLSDLAGAENHFVTFANSVSVGGVTIPRYSKGVLTCSSTADATLMVLDSNGNLYTAFRANTTWIKGNNVSDDTASDFWYIPMEIWDYTTLRVSYSTSQYNASNFNARCMNIGAHLWLISLYLPSLDLTSINTMLQIKFPGYVKDEQYGQILGGSFYIAALENSAHTRTTIQASGMALYPRPNITKAIGKNSSIITAIVFVRH